MTSPMYRTTCRSTALLCVLPLITILTLAFAGSASAATFVNDTMTGSAGTTLQAHTGETGATWTRHPSSADVVLTTANRVRSATASKGLYTASGSPASANYTVSADAYSASTTRNAGPTCRTSLTDQTFYMLRYYNNPEADGVELYKFVNGTATLLDTSPQAPAIGSTHNLSLSCIGTAITGKYDGTQVVSATDSSITAAGKAGMRIYHIAVGESTGLHLDNFVAADPAGCDLNATPANFAAQVTAATTGQTICLASGSYGTWAGTSKAITIKPQSGASPMMQINFGSGDTGFTLDGMGGMGGSILTGASNITVRNATFTSPVQITGTNMGVTIDSSHFDWNAVYNGGTNGKIRVDNSTGAFSGVTISNSTIKTGDLDGVHLGAGVNLIGNEFSELCDRGTNHTDNIQFEGGTGGRIAGNWIHAATCETQGLTSFDSGTVGVTIEDNVIDIERPWGIEFYSDRDSIIRHNTMVWRPDSNCEYTGQQCGQISLDHKTADPAGSGTRVYDNVATAVNINPGSAGTADHNVSGQTVSYVGPLTSWAGYHLTSPKGTASDGLDVGIR